MKRGLPIDDSNVPRRHASTTSISISPQSTPYSTIPPPAKRHQTSHPGQAETPPTRPPDMHQYPPQPVDRPPYGYYPSPIPQHAPPPPGPYQTAPTYQAPVQDQSPPMPYHQRPPEQSPYGPNGHGTPPHLPLPTSAENRALSLQQQRQFSSHYDTRPPPAAQPSSGFAAINQPSSNSGFAAVNARTTAPSPSSEPLVASEHKHSRGTNQTPSRPSMDEDDRTPSGNGSSKRTPSTTHPYQMSEAFANRHHHCEKTDGLNRGIWTWYGPGGKDHPTEPPTEMYLRCNHDGCRRIDWRTVHGLQCHIVKNHEIPKGTIGSLEKALAAYGVPVKDVEAFEEINGHGSGGTMADPKNNKLRTRRTAAERRAMTPADDKSVHHASTRSMSPNSILLSHKKQYHSYGDHFDSESENAPADATRIEPSRPSGGFAAVNAHWKPVDSGGHKRQHSNDLEVRAGLTSMPMRRSRPEETPSKAPLPFWSSWQASENLPGRPQSSGLKGAFHPQPDALVPQTQKLKQEQEAPEKVQPHTGMQALEREMYMNAFHAAGALVANRDLQDHVDGVTDEHHAPVASITNVAVQSHSARLDTPSVSAVQQSGKDEIQVTDDPTPQKPGASLAPAPEFRKQSPIPQVNREGAIEKKIEHDMLMIEAKDNAGEEPKPARSPTTIGRTSRRASRRTSIATASSKAGTEKSKEDEAEIKTAVDDDEDTIVVGKEKKEDKETTTPVRRLANGRFTRNKR